MKEIYFDTARKEQAYMSNLIDPEFKIREVAERIRLTRESVGLELRISVSALSINSQMPAVLR